MEINIISTELIKPSSPTASDCKNYKVSFIDERIPHSYIPLILYYPTPISLNQPQISKWLKSSLSEALSIFYPMAGRIKDQISIDCNDEGIFYAESQVDGHLSELMKRPEIRILGQLIPCKSCGTVSDANELLAIQVNYFKCGGIAIGICHSHRIADGCTLSSFISWWAATAWNAYACGSRKTVSSALPVFNSASVFPPRNSLEFKPNLKSRALQPPREKLVTKRFIFTPSTIELLKSQVINRFPDAKPTRVQLVSAYVWKCCMAAEGLEKRHSSLASHPVNLRRRFVPALPGSSFGNIFQMAFAVASGGEDWIGLVGILSDAIGKLDQNFCKKLLGENGYEFAKCNFDKLGKYLSEKDMHIIRFSSWCGFPLYDADFGWGNPIWVSSASYSCKNNVFLFDSKSGSGIEAWVALAEHEMRTFEQEMDFNL